MVALVTLELLREAPLLHGGRCGFVVFFRPVQLDPLGLEDLLVAWFVQVGLIFRCRRNILFHDAPVHHAELVFVLRIEQHEIGEVLAVALRPLDLKILSRVELHTIICASHKHVLSAAVTR